jgi:hypothetical protein
MKTFLPSKFIIVKRLFRFEAAFFIFLIDNSSRLDSCGMKKIVYNHKQKNQ